MPILGAVLNLVKLVLDWGAFPTSLTFDRRMFPKKLMVFRAIPRIPDALGGEEWGHARVGMQRFVDLVPRARSHSR